MSAGTDIVPAMPAPSAIQQHRTRQEELIRVVGIQAAAEYVMDIGPRRYMQVVGLAMLGSAMGYSTRSLSCTRVQIPDGPGAWMAESVVIDAEGVERGRGIAYVSDDEPQWGKRPHFARAAMAQTRAQGRALRQCIGWVVGLIGGIEATPYEEMPEAEPSPAPRKRVVAEAPAAPAPKAPASVPAGFTGEAAQVLQVRLSASAPEAKRQWSLVAAELEYADGARHWAGSFDATIGAAIRALEGKRVLVRLDGPRDAARVKVLGIEAAPGTEGGPDGDYIPF